MYELNFTKEILNTTKFLKDIKALNLSVNFIDYTSKGTDFTVRFSSIPTQQDIDAIYYLINNFVETDLTEQLKEYVKKKVRPFLEDLTFRIKASNIENGITQLNKTSDFLSFMSNRITLPGKTRTVSLDAAIQNDSLDVIVQIANYYIDNPELYSDLSPFVTVEKIQEWRDEVIQFLQENSI